MNAKNIIHSLISKYNKRKLELSIYEAHLIKLVPSLPFVYNFIKLYLIVMFMCCTKYNSVINWKQVFSYTKYLQSNQSETL
jgi:hypothetical protein